MAEQPPPTKRQRVDDKAGIDEDFVQDKAVVNDDDNDDDAETLMPPTPRVPPEASTEGKEKRYYYGPSDTALWPEEAADLFRATKINFDPKYASRYMRQWFETHEGMPGRVPKAPRSAYSIYFNEQKGVIYRSSGKFNKNKDSKKIGAAWKVLSEDEKQPYIDGIVTQRAKRDANEAWWKEKMAMWREERRKRLQSDGVELDPLKRQNAGLTPLCECLKCVPDLTLP